MIKTFEQFASQRDVEKAKKEMYTPEEFKEVYDIVSEYYDGDGDIEAFICASDKNGVREKTDFVDEHNLYGKLDVCHYCGKFVVSNEDDDEDGCIIVDNTESYCSWECFQEVYPYKWDSFVEDGLIKIGWKGEVLEPDTTDYRTEEEKMGHSWTGGIS